LLLLDFLAVDCPGEECPGEERPGGGGDEGCEGNPAQSSSDSSSSNCSIAAESGLALTVRGRFPCAGVAGVESFRARVARSVGGAGVMGCSIFGNIMLHCTDGNVCAPFFCRDDIK